MAPKGERWRVEAIVRAGAHCFILEKYGVFVDALVPGQKLRTRTQGEVSSRIAQYDWMWTASSRRPQQPQETL